MKNLPRALLVADLRKEVLGPRSGIHEFIAANPMSEYLCGVLVPADAQSTSSNELEAAEEWLSVAEESEEDTVDTDVYVPPLLSPALSPQERPHSFGLFFTLRCDNEQKPSFDICVTWARYFREEGGSGWSRKPRYAIIREVNSSSRYFLGEKGVVSDHEPAEAELVVQYDESCRVRVYFVNKINLQDGSGGDKTRFAGVSECIFQPQIRIKLRGGAELVPTEEISPETEDNSQVDDKMYPAEDEILGFLYRERPVYARGFLCAAIWKDIDPEQLARLSLDNSTENPFEWFDGELITEETYGRHFKEADVRTEFVPVYSVQSPSLEWDEKAGTAPELDAETLAEMWDPEDLRKQLAPLSESYREWIEKQKLQLSSLGVGRPRQIGSQIIRQCETIAERIEKGIEVLCADEDARLAFCFAMKAMALQASWPAGRRPLRWYPFQLAFILMCIESIVNSRSDAREVCDLLWVPTGAGKTEAYLAVAAFTLAYRRRQSLGKNVGDRSGAGVAVISRYTLRLLTIQQFRRALKMITACELLRVSGFKGGQTSQPVGWRPQNCNISQSFLWGSGRFSVGLWVGGGVTPNRLDKIWGGSKNLPGALQILKGEKGEGEPAQVTNCPVCDTILAFTECDAGEKIRLFLTVKTQPNKNFSISKSYGKIAVLNHLIHPLNENFSVLELDLEAKVPVGSGDVDEWWKSAAGNTAELLSARASRPGYFFRYYINTQRNKEEYDFEIFCPNPCCPLHQQPWCEGWPLGWICGATPAPNSPQNCDSRPSREMNQYLSFPDGNKYAQINPAFRLGGSPYISRCVPIPAWTVDEQVYHRCPSMIIATADKFARLSFEPKSASLFGNVSFYHCVHGYYRPGEHNRVQNNQDHPSPAGRGASNRLYCTVAGGRLAPPDLILQDELHLLEGPLGSMAGIYETAVEFLCEQSSDPPVKPKYISSTATVRRAEEQIKSLFARRVQLFPHPGLDIDDSFFVRYARNLDPLDEQRPGRLYLGICAPGRGPLTPIVRIWARLLQSAYELTASSSAGVDPYWTLTGYFNAVRELAGARALYRQDIPERLQILANNNQIRKIPEEGCRELSGRTPSTLLPSILEQLSRSYPNAIDALFTTSMFGTGIDISRLALMVVHGQPKTTSAYIQATGRVGRTRGALVVVFYRATRPRDLNHYEFFTGYHHQLYRFVEPVTVVPFASGVLARACGPVSVAMLRNSGEVQLTWYKNSDCKTMAQHRQSADVKAIREFWINRASRQPLLRQPAAPVESVLDPELDRWEQVAKRQINGDLVYVEYAINSTPSRHVILGDAQHQHPRYNLEVVYPNAPQSLRDVEETCGFEV